MDVFFTGFITLLIILAIYLIVWVSFIYYWHLKKISIIIVPTLFVFEALLRGFWILVGITLFFHYAPIISKMLNL